MNVVTSDVVHHLKLLLSYVVKDKTFNEVYHFTDEQILFHIVNHYKLQVYDRFQRIFIS